MRNEGALRRALRVFGILLLFFVSTVIKADDEQLVTSDFDLDRKLGTIESILRNTFPMDEAKLTQAYTQAFPEGVASTAIKAKNSSLLLRAADVVDQMGFYTHQPRFAEELRQLIVPIQRSGAQHQVWVKRLFGLHVASRNFDLANHLRTQFSDVVLPMLPQLESPVLPAELGTALKPENNGLLLRRVTVDIRHGPWVVALVQPHCGFSKEAVAEISSDMELAQSLSGRSWWLMPQEATLNTGLVNDWQRRYPLFPLHYIFRREEWPQLDTTAVPQFYFFRDGILIEHWPHWPEKDGNQQLAAVLQKIGISNE
ncbi:MAG: hypothetical protein ACK4E7_16305 [Permianibacter sp.]